MVDDNHQTASAELIPAVKVGQVWRQRKIGGMWRTVIAIHPAGVEWTANPDEHEMSQWKNWDQWVRYTEAEIAIDVG